MILLIASFNAPHLPLPLLLSHTCTQTTPGEDTHTQPSRATFQARPAYTSTTARSAWLCGDRRREQDAHKGHMLAYSHVIAERPREARLEELCPIMTHYEDEPESRGSACASVHVQRNCRSTTVVQGFTCSRLMLWQRSLERKFWAPQFCQ